MLASTSTRCCAPAAQQRGAQACQRVALRPRARSVAWVSLPRSAAVDTAEVQTKPSSVLAIDAGQFEEVLAAHELVLVDYYTDWCGPCKMIAPYLEELATEMPHIKFTKLNCTSDPAAKKIAMAQGIKALPTFHMFRKGTKVGVSVGGKPAALRKFVEEMSA